MAEWQPIESAPIDGTPIRVRFYRPGVYETYDGKHQNWHSFGWYNENDKWGASGSWKRYLPGTQTKISQNFSWTPTHWTSLFEKPDDEY